MPEKKAPSSTEAHALPQDQVRLSNRQEASQCAAILNAWIDTTDWFPRIHDAADVERYYVNHVFETRTLWVTGTPVTGFLSLDTDNFVTALYTAMPGRGVGKRLLDHARKEARKLNLWTFVANTGAQRFYQREGFVEVRRTDGDNEEGLPDILYQWEAQNA
jgi:GNAT superfamily N-acetyltransferase